MMEIYKTFIFHAAHRMTNMPKSHKYSKIHGHSFAVDIYVKGVVDKKDGWVMDFQEIEKAFKPCLLYTSPSPRDATLSRMPSSA